MSSVRKLSAPAIINTIGLQEIGVVMRRGVMSWNPYARLPLRHIKKCNEDGIEKDVSYGSYIRTCSMPLAADRRGLIGLIPSIDC